MKYAWSNPTNPFQSDSHDRKIGQKVVGLNRHESGKPDILIISPDEALSLLTTDTNWWLKFGKPALSKSGYTIVIDSEYESPE